VGGSDITVTHIAPQQAAGYRFRSVRITIFGFLTTICDDFRGRASGRRADAMTGAFESATMAVPREEGPAS
jgi:hypothetical protein